MTQGVKREVTIRGVTYKSLSEASRSLGVSVPAISKAIKEKRIDRINQGGTRYPTTIRGVTYPSQSEAARSIGIKRRSLAKSIDMGRLETAGLGISQPVKIECDGIIYENILEFSKSKGIISSRIYNHMTKHKKGRFDYYEYKGIKFRRIKD